MSTTTIQRDHIKELIDYLPESTLSELGDFIEFLAEKERRKKAFVEQTLDIERKSEPSEFPSASRRVKQANVKIINSFY